MSDVTVDLDRGADPRRRSIATLVVAAAVVAIVTVVVIAFGIAPYPDVPRLADQPEPAVTAQLAYLAYDREPCLHVVDGSGLDREVRCGSDVEGGALAWQDDGHVLVHRYRFEEEIVTIDVATGQVTETRPATAAEQKQPVPAGVDQRADGARVATTGSDGTARVEVRTSDGVTTTVLELEGPDGYRLEDARWSHDGDWIVVRDTAQRLLVFGADGEPAPRTWITDVWDYAVR